MQFPSELANTTLGDVLGALHRAQVSGCLQLTEPSGRRHSVFLDAGVVRHLQSDLGRRLGDVLRARGNTSTAISQAIERHAFDGMRLLGEALVEEGCITRRQLSDALVVQQRERLEALFALRRARLRFNVARERSGSGARPIEPSEFLRGKPRARDGRRPAARYWGHGVVKDGHDVAAALALLGLDEQAHPDVIRSAYRQRAAALHPDRYPDASALERVSINQRFARLTAAYRLLVA
jgi:Domain of unknown function (DUF4388)/DnaJ domain